MSIFNFINDSKDQNFKFQQTYFKYPHNIFKIGAHAGYI